MFCVYLSFTALATLASTSYAAWTGTAAFSGDGRADNTCATAIDKTLDFTITSMIVTETSWCYRSNKDGVALKDTLVTYDCAGTVKTQFDCTDDVSAALACSNCKVRGVADNCNDDRKITFPKLLDEKSCIAMGPSKVRSDYCGTLGVHLYVKSDAAFYTEWNKICAKAKAGDTPASPSAAATPSPAAASPAAASPAAPQQTSLVVAVALAIVTSALCAW